MRTPRDSDLPSRRDPLPDPPPDLEQRVLAAYRALGLRHSCWDRFWSWEIRVPAPVAVAAALVLLVVAGAQRWNAHSAAPAAAHPSVAQRLAETSLDGFHPVHDLRPYVIRGKYAN